MHPATYLAPLVGEADPRIREWLANALGNDGRDVEMFDGPRMSAIGGERYITLTSFGEKSDGESRYSDPDCRCWTPEEALFRFKRVLLERIKATDCNQLAWRRYPAIERGPDGDYVASCRLALLKTPKMADAELLRSAASD